MSAADFTKLAELFPDETVTHSYVQDIELPALPDGPAPGLCADHAGQRPGPLQAHHTRAQHPG